MPLSEADHSVLTGYTRVAQKIIYNAERMKVFLKMMKTPQGAVQAVETVLGAIDQRKPVPPQIAPLLGVNCYMIMLDVLQSATKAQMDPNMVQQVIAMILKDTQRNAAAPKSAPPTPPAQPQGMLARLQEQGEAEPAGEGPGPDNTAMHEGAEPADTEQAEGSEEDGMLARMQRRRVAA